MLIQLTHFTSGLGLAANARTAQNTKSSADLLILFDITTPSTIIQLMVKFAPQSERSN
jgi:hypothetical protein